MTSTIGEVMGSPLEAISANATLQEAAIQMRDRSVGLLLALDEGQPAGVVTDRDITLRATAKGLDPRHARVRDAMTAQVVACRADEPLGVGLRLMEQKAVRRLVVLDEEGRCVGLLSLDDVARSPEEAPRVGSILEHIIQPAPDQ